MNTRATQRLLVRTNSALLAATLALGTFGTGVSLAQDATPQPNSTSATPAVAEPGVTRRALMDAQFSSFPPAPMTVRMLRITMEPGASVPLHTHPGVEFDRIEKGSVEIASSDVIPVTRADGQKENAPAEGTTLQMDDWVVFEPSHGMTFKNTGNDPVVMLSAVLLPVGNEYPQSITYTNGKPDASAFSGVSYTVLGDGLLQAMPAGTVQVQIGEMEVGPNAAIPGSSGAAMYSEESGPFAFTVENGMVQVSRTTLRSLQPNAVLGEQFTLAAGDAAFFPAGVTSTVRDGQSGTLRLLTLEMRFTSSMADDPASLTITATKAGSATPAASPAASPIAATSPLGRTVTTNDDGVNMRADASTDADLVEQLDANTSLKIIGGPTKVEDRVWYKVQLTDGSEATGWVASDYLNGLQGETTSDGTASSTPTTTPVAKTTTTFKAGDVVTTTEDNVRIRPSAGTKEDAVDAFPAGTRLTVTGDAVVVDGETWVPVSATWDETISGFVPAQYLAPARN